MTKLSIQVTKGDQTVNVEVEGLSAPDIVALVEKAIGDNPKIIPAKHIFRPNPYAVGTHI